MNEYIILLFVFVWAFSDRLREIAVFPGWESKWGKWFDTYYTPDMWKWIPWRDAYHLFKAVAIWFLVLLIFIIFGWEVALYIYAAWAVGQFAGLVARKKLT